MPRILIDAQKKTNLYAYILELFQYRELIVHLAYRDFRIRYARTKLGLLWALIQPILTLMIFGLVFHQFLEVQTTHTPYFLFAFSGLFAWNYFAFVVQNVGVSLLNYQNLIQKVYFPRMVLPLSKALLGLSDLSINALFFVFLMLFYRIVPSFNLIFLPFLIGILIVFALGLGMLIAATSVYVRDLQALIPFLLQIGLYLSPIAYPVDLVPEAYRIWYYLNPMAGIMAGLRWSIFGENFPVFAWISYGLIFLIFLGAFVFFRKVEDVLSDIL